MGDSSRNTFREIVMKEFRHQAGCIDSTPEGIVADILEERRESGAAEICRKLAQDSLC